MDPIRLPPLNFTALPPPHQHNSFHHCQLPPLSLAHNHTYSLPSPSPPPHSSSNFLNTHHHHVSHLPSLHPLLAETAHAIVAPHVPRPQQSPIARYRSLVDHHQTPPVHRNTSSSSSSPSSTASPTSSSSSLSLTSTPKKKISLSLLLPQQQQHQHQSTTPPHSKSHLQPQPQQTMMATATTATCLPPSISNLISHTDDQQYPISPVVKPWQRLPQHGDLHQGGASTTQQMMDNADCSYANRHSSPLNLLPTPASASAPAPHCPSALKPHTLQAQPSLSLCPTELQCISGLPPVPTTTTTNLTSINTVNPGSRSPNTGTATATATDTPTTPILTPTPPSSTIITTPIATTTSSPRHVSSMAPVKRAIQTPKGFREVYTCPFPSCTRISSEHSNMKAHMRLHTGERPYICRVASCRKSFRWKSSLTYHERALHSNSRPYQCGACHKSFVEKRKLRLHHQLCPAVRAAHSQVGPSFRPLFK